MADNNNNGYNDGFDGHAPKAYLNEVFLKSHDARTVRILAEYNEPESRFRDGHINNTICFFGSARLLPRDIAEAALAEAQKKGSKEDIEKAQAKLETSRYYEDARKLAHMLTEWSINDTQREDYYIMTGGGPGIMEAGNRGAYEAHGESIGLGISLPNEPTQNKYITPKWRFEFHYFFMRKFWFMYTSKAMVAFPGGFGTFDELFEFLTLVQTRKVSKQIPIVLYGTDYWNEIFNLKVLAEKGTISPDDVDLLYYSDTPEDTFEYLKKELLANEKQ